MTRVAWLSGGRARSVELPAPPAATGAGHGLPPGVLNRTLPLVERRRLYAEWAEDRAWHRHPGHPGHGHPGGGVRAHEHRW